MSCKHVLVSGKEGKLRKDRKVEEGLVASQNECLGNRISGQRLQDSILFSLDKRQSEDREQISGLWQPEMKDRKILEFEFGTISVLVQLRLYIEKQE